MARSLTCPESPLELSSLSPRKMYATAKEWESIRGTFTRLYRDQGKTLKNVEDILRREHSFFATTKMYKVRIKKWKLDNKKLKEAEVAQILHLQRQREAVDKRSVFFINGRRIKWTDIDTYLKRKQPRRDSVRLPEVINTDFGIVCRTPSPEPVLKSSIPDVLQPPPNLQLLDEMFRIIRVYCDGAIDSGVWVRSDSGRFYGRGGREAARGLRSWARRFPLATAHLHQGESKLAFQLLGKLFERFAEIIRQQDFVLLIVLFSIALDSSVSWPELHQLFIKHAADMLGVLLGKSHPLSLVWQRLSLVSDSERPFAITTTLRCVVECFGHRFGFSDRSALQLQFGYLGLLDNHRESNMNEIERNISLLTKVSSGKGGSLDEDARIDVLSQLAYEQVRSGKVQDAEQTLELMHPWTEDPSNRDKISWPVIRYFYLKNKGRTCMADARFEEAGQYYREMYRHSNQHYGPSHDRTLAAITLLVKYFQELGQAGEASKWQYLFKEGCVIVHGTESLNNSRKATD